MFSDKTITDISQMNRKTNAIEVSLKTKKFYKPNIYIIGITRELKVSTINLFEEIYI